MAQFWNQQLKGSVRFPSDHNSQGYPLMMAAFPAGPAGEPVVVCGAGHPNILHLPKKLTAGTLKTS